MAGERPWSSLLSLHEQIRQRSACAHSDHLDSTIVRMCKVTEEEARLALLQTELNAIQSGIRGLDTVLMQIKGWCVTASLAIGGFAVAYHQPALLIVGAGAVVGFYLVTCQFRMIQRAFIERNIVIDSELRTTGIMQVLKGAGNFEILGTAPLDLKGRRSGLSYSAMIRSNLPAFWHEARMPNTFSLYLFIMACLIVEAIILS
jgi:hypothetical protein